MFDGSRAISSRVQNNNLVSVDFEKRDQNGDNYLLQLIKKGNIKEAESLLEDYKKYVNDANKEGETALYLAVQSNSLSLVKQLIELGANVLECDNDGLSPLAVALELESEDILWAILNHEKVTLNSLALGAFMSALENLKKEAALKFFDKGFVFPVSFSGLGFKALETTLNMGYTEIADRLLTTELVGQLADKERYDLFKIVLRQPRCRDIALRLVQTIPLADIHADKYSYLEQACWRGSPAIVSYLITNNLDIRDVEIEHYLLDLINFRSDVSDFEEVIKLFLDKIAEQQKSVDSRNKALSKLCERVLKSFPDSMKEKIALEIIHRMVPEERSKDTLGLNTFDDIFIVAVQKNCQQVISHFLNEGKKHLEPDLSTLIQSLLIATTHRNESVALQLINYWISSGRDLTELRGIVTFNALDNPSVTDPKRQLWIFNTCLQSDLCVNHFQQLYEQMFIQLLQLACEGKLTFGPDFFQKALKIFSVEHMRSILVQTMGLDKKRNDENETTGLDWHEVVNLLVAMGSEACHTYLSASLPGLIQQFKSLAIKGSLSIEDSRALANLFPEETIPLDLRDSETDESQRLALNFFTLTAHSSFFRSYLSGRWSNRFPIEGNPTLFKIMFKVVSEKKLEVSKLNQESFVALKEMAKQFGVDLSILENYSCDGNHKKFFYSEFFENSYSFCDQEELILNEDILSFWPENSDLISYFLRRVPDLKIVKMSSNLFSSRSNQIALKEFITNPKFEEIHIDLKDLRKSRISLSVVEEYIKDFIKLVGPNCGFYFNGFKHLNVNSLKAITKIPNLVLKGLDLPEEIQETLSDRPPKKQLSLKEELDASSIPLENLEYLDLSDTGVDEKVLLELVRKIPKLREINLQNCRSVSDGVLSALASTCPQLISVNLCGVHQVDVLQFVKNCPNLEILRISPRGDRELRQIIEVSKGFTLYVDDSQVLRKEDIPQKFALLGTLVDQKDLYLLEDYLHFILKRVLDEIMQKKGSFNDNRIMVKILNKIAEKKSDSLHPFVLYVRSIRNSEELKCLCMTLAINQNLLLDHYLPKEFVQQLHTRLVESKPSLFEARKLARLFYGDKINVYVKGSDISFSFDPLVLQSSGSEILRRWDSSDKIKVFSNPLIFKYIYRYLTEGQVNLKRLNIHACLKVCKELSEYQLSQKDFFDAATEGVIGIKLKPYTAPAIINKFLKYPKLVEKVTMIDLVQIDVDSNLQPILNLVSTAKNLKVMRLSTSKPIPQELWNIIESQKIEAVLILNSDEGIKQFDFPDLLKNEMWLRLERANDFHLSLTEYIKFMERCPGLIEIDISGYPITTESTELNKIISLCKTKNITILNLGNCANLNEKDFDLIAKNCLSLKTLIGQHPCPNIINQAFTNNARAINCQIEIPKIGHLTI